MNTFGPVYLNSKLQTLYTVAPLGSVLCKAIGGTKWIPSAMTKGDLEKRIEQGQLVKR